MAARTTRAKIRAQCEKAEVHLDHVMERLRRVEELGGEHSPVVEGSIPMLAQACMELQKAIHRFRANC